MHRLLILLAEDPVPVPTMTVPASAVTPGPWGFSAIAVVAILAAVLIWDMLRRIRRARYREEVAAQLDAEQAAAAVVDASNTDDQTLDAADAVDPTIVSDPDADTPPAR